MKKKLLYFLPLLMISLSVCVYGYVSPAKYADKIPAFRMQLSNGSYFSATAIPKNKPVVLIYFAPDCEHCQVLMNALFKKMSEFKKTELVMVTFKPLNEVAGFERLYETKKYPNIIVGTEGTTFFLRNYYQLMNTPFTALYDRSGNLVCSYKDKTPLDDLIARVKQLH